MCLKFRKSGHTLVMLCRKAKNADRKKVAHNFFATPWGIFATPWKKSCNSPGTGTGRDWGQGQKGLVQGQGEEQRQEWTEAKAKGHYQEEAWP